MQKIVVYNKNEHGKFQDFIGSLMDIGATIVSTTAERYDFHKGNQVLSKATVIVDLPAKKYKIMFQMPGKQGHCYTELEEVSIEDAKVRFFSKQTFRSAKILHVAEVRKEGFATGGVVESEAQLEAKLKAERVAQLIKIIFGESIFKRRQ